MNGVKLARKKKKTESSLKIGEGHPHKPKQARPHIAQEYREKGQEDIAEDMVRNLRTWAARSATGQGRVNHGQA